MKSKLIKIINTENYEGLKQYVRSGHSVDYNFQFTYMNIEYSLNPLIFCLIFSPKLAKVLLEELDDLTIKDFISCIGKSLDLSFVFVKNDGILNEKDLNVIYDYLPDENKKKINENLNKVPLSQLKVSNSLNFLKEENLLRKILEDDDHKELIEFIAKNNKFNYFYNASLEDNYLMVCVKNNSVLCFDILKDHMKSIKSKNNLENTKIRP